MGWASRDAKKVQCGVLCSRLARPNRAHVLRGRGAKAGCGTAKAETMYRPIVSHGRAPHIPLVAGEGPVCFLFEIDRHCELINPSTLHVPFFIGSPPSQSNILVGGR